jgi:chaperone modulatory protein CbpM
MNERGVEAVEPDPGEALTLRQVCAILELRTEVICEWVSEGIVHPSGRRVDQWRFPPRELERARRARRLQRDLALNTESLPLVLDLLGEVERLRRRVRVLESRFFE